MKEITVHELKSKIDSGEKPLILDVREIFEQYQSNIEYDRSILIPVGQLPSRLEEVESHTDSDDEIICMCRSGSRSADACKILMKNGFENVKNLKGGINQWARQIDQNLPIY